MSLHVLHILLPGLKLDVTHLLKEHYVV